MTREEDATRPITLPPRAKCLKPKSSKCAFRDKEGNCEKRITTCPFKSDPHKS